MQFKCNFYMRGVRPKKFLGQHFLKDQNTADRIVNSVSNYSDDQTILEIGPGTGVLTNFLVEKPSKNLFLVEVDRESIQYLEKHFDTDKITIVEKDFLQLDLNDLTDDDMVIIGNFPYFISSQIFFKILDQKKQVKEIVCMIQKEVAERICAPHGNKTYGIITVLIGLHYDSQMLFKVPPGVFVPPPKVDSAVIKLTRKDDPKLPDNEALFTKIVKQSFQNRRKTLRNALKPIFLPKELTSDKIFDLRAEQLSIEDFILLTENIQKWTT